MNILIAICSCSVGRTHTLRWREGWRTATLKLTAKKKTTKQSHVNIKWTYFWLPSQQQQLSQQTESQLIETSLSRNKLNERGDTATWDTHTDEMYFCNFTFSFFFAFDWILFLEFAINFLACRWCAPKWGNEIQTENIGKAGVDGIDVRLLHHCYVFVVQ